MDDKIIATFCLCDDLLKAMQHQEDHQEPMNDAEIMTTAFIASLFFRGNHESARAMLKQHGSIPHMLSKSRFRRRLHRMKALFLVFFDLLGQTWKTLHTDAIDVIDSIPIAVCDNVRIRRSKISAEPKLFLHLSPNFRAVMLWATDLLRPATISGSSPRPIALKRVAHAIHPRFKPRNDPIASKDLQKKPVSPSEATCSVSFAQLSGGYN
jgi:hypothetical protein